MSDVTGLLVGLAFFVGGFALLLNWWPMFLYFVMGIIPMFAMMIGAGVLLYFISAIKWKSEMKKEEEEFHTSGRFRVGEM